MAPRKSAPPKFNPEKLRSLRGDRAYHVLAVEIAQKTGVSIHFNTLKSYEEEGSVPGGEKLSALAAYFGIAIDDFFE